MVQVTPSGPSDNPFEGLPFFGDLAKLLGQGGGIPWEAARSLALAVATEGQSEPNVDPVERIKLEQLARVAELHVANVTGLSTGGGGTSSGSSPSTGRCGPPRPSRPSARCSSGWRRRWVATRTPRIRRTRPTSCPTI